MTENLIKSTELNTDSLDFYIGQVLTAAIITSITLSAETSHQSCGILVLHDGGLASNINLLSLVVYPYKTFYIDGEKFPYKCWPEGGNWDRLFHGNVREKPETGAENCTVHILPNEPMYEMHRLYNEKKFDGHNSAFQEKGKALLKVWPLSERATRYSNAHVRFVRSLPRPLTAVHVRHGDKAIEDHWRGQNQVYGPVDFARAALSYEGARNGTCIVYGDDFAANHATAQQLLRLLKCYPIVIGGSAGHVQSMFNSKDLKERCSLADCMVAELHGMAASDYFIGSMNSNIPRLVSLMRSQIHQHDQATARDVQDMQWHPW